MSSRSLFLLVLVFVLLPLQGTGQGKAKSKKPVPFEDILAHATTWDQKVKDAQKTGNSIIIRKTLKDAQADIQKKYPVGTSVVFTGKVAYIGDTLDGVRGRNLLAVKKAKANGRYSISLNNPKTVQGKAVTLGPRALCNTADKELAESLSVFDDLSLTGKLLSPLLYFGPRSRPDDPAISAVYLGNCVRTPKK